MMQIRTAFVIGLLLLSCPATARETCNWCVFGNKKITDEVVALAKLPPKKLLKAIRAKKVCVQVMASRRKVPAKTFSWGAIEAPTLPLSQVTKIGGLMGKMLCRAELPIADKCPLIVLASDAPFTTLLHEYVHFVQAVRDEGWCRLSKELWQRATNEKDWERQRDKEWDVHLLLWNIRDKIPLALDDKIAIASETINEAEARKGIDPDGERFLLLEQPREYLRKATEEYKKKMGIKQ